MQDLSAAAIQASLRAQTVGRRLEVRERVGSTLDVLAELAAAGAPEGTVVFADHQRQGRGRLGRAWLAPPGTALLMSVLFRPPLAPERVGQVGMAVALGALDGLRQWDGFPEDLPLALKWPNDLLCRDLKLGGLLAEASWPPTGPAEVRVGLGLNVRQAPEALPPGAISLAMVLDRVPDRSWLAAAILNAVDRHYAALQAGGDLLESWSRHLATLGQEVVAHRADGIVSGCAVGVTRTGALIVRADDGTEVELEAGDVSLRGALPPRTVRRG